MRGTLLTSTGDVTFNIAWFNNLSATTDPGVGDDVADGYSPGSVWVNTSTSKTFQCISNAAGAAVWNQTSSSTDDNAQFTAPPATTATGNGGNALLKGGAGGTTSGNGGGNTISGGDATAGNGNGGDVNISGGAKNGTGVNGVTRTGGIVFVAQGAPAAKTVSGLLTAANLLAGIITVNQGAAGASAQQLPLATDLDTALPSSVAGDAFDFSVINTSTVDAEDASVTTNTGWTLVGNMDLQAHSALAAQGSSGRFRARKTGTGAWTLYRLA